MTQNNDLEQENILILIIGVKSDTSWTEVDRISICVMLNVTRQMT